MSFQLKSDGIFSNGAEDLLGGISSVHQEQNDLYFLLTKC